jgi:hypothetical protein
MALEFRFEELEEEIESFSGLAQSYLEASSMQVLRAWLDQLRSIRGAQSGLHYWSISEERPLWTNLCTEEQNARDPELLGRLSMVWGITIPIGTPRGKGNRSHVFELSGIASTKVSLWRRADNGGSREVARWSFEVGSDDSPGCHFHVQIKADDTDRLFPPSLSIPRLPGILITPIDALDFLLGEVFQETWKKHLGKETDALNAWSAIQRARMLKLLDWHQQEIRKGRGAVWSCMKHAKPDAKQLLSA